MRFGGHDGEHGTPVARHRFTAMFALVALALMLTACGATLDVDNIGRAEIRQTAASKAVVIGQLHIRSVAGRSIIPAGPSGSYENPSEGTSVLLVRLAEDSATGSGTPRVNADGRFAWALDTGTYVIERIAGWAPQMSFYYRFCPKTVFRVEQSAGIVNLGEIAIVLLPDQEELKFVLYYCKETKIHVDVTQNEGDITKLVRQPLTPVVVAPELPVLWESSMWGSVTFGNAPEARAVLRRLGVTISGQSAADGQ